MILQTKYNKFPTRVLDNPTDFLSYVEGINYNGKIIYPANQIKVYEKTLKKPLENNYIYLMSCDYNNILPQLAVKKLYDIVSEHYPCFWYNVSINHKSEDTRLVEFVDNYPDMSLLVIDGVYSRTNINNIDKVRELLALFDYIPICVIISGDTGPEVFTKIVNHPFNACIHFGSEANLSRDNKGKLKRKQDKDFDNDFDEPIDIPSKNIDNEENQKKKLKKLVPIDRKITQF